MVLFHTGDTSITFPILCKTSLVGRIIRFSLYQKFFVFWILQVIFKTVFPNQRPVKITCVMTNLLPHMLSYWANEFIRNHPGVVGFGASFLYFDFIVNSLIRKNKPVTDVIYRPRVFFLGVKWIIYVLWVYLRFCLHSFFDRAFCSQSI